MKNKILIENIFICLKKSDIKYLPKYFFHVPKPSSASSKMFDLVISTDQNLKNKTKQDIYKYLKKTIFGSYVNQLNFISANLPKYLSFQENVNKEEKINVHGNNL